MAKSANFDLIWRTKGKSNYKGFAERAYRFNVFPGGKLTAAIQSSTPNRSSIPRRVNANPSTPCLSIITFTALML